MSNITIYHTSVMLEPCIKALQIMPHGCYVDATFGGGGHSRLILEHLGEDGKLIAFDQDIDAQQNKPNDNRFTLIQQNFKYLKNYLKMMQALPVHGILADLGVSSFQFDTAERGFSYRFDAPLDMRMNQAGGITAKQVINEYEESKLADVFYHYGEFRESRKIAAVVVNERQHAPIETTGALAALMEKLFPPKHFKKELSRIFQALRIEVNGEMEALKAFLQQSIDVLDSGGRLVVLTYHSLEDRMVKNFMRAGNLSGEVEKDFFGVSNTPFKVLGKAQVPSNEEMEANPRARSAKLRIAEKK